jgi:cellulase
MFIFQSHHDRMLTSTSYQGYIVSQFPYEASPPAVIGWTETATDLGFVAPSAYATGNISCHKDATNAKATATVKAGGTVVMEWNTWPGSHHGPVIDYVSSSPSTLPAILLPVHR